jgi:L-histidine N-alpha-methyltransferase
MGGRALDRFEGIHPAGPPDSRFSLGIEVASGLRETPQARLPAKLLYDARGSELFDRICELPEYYPTRTERLLLERVSPDIAARSEARELVELGSGLARKTHLLLDALTARCADVRYVPFDVSVEALRQSSERILLRYPRVRLRGIVGDFTQNLEALPPGTSRLVALLGGTIGNLDGREMTAFLDSVARVLRPDDHFLLAADLLKPVDILHAAYNDAAGVTAAFNLNVIQRLHGELGFHLSEAAFRHEAFFDEETSRIEMHARLIAPTAVDGPAWGLRRTFQRGESIRTEISRKFTERDIEGLLGRAGLEVVALYVAQPGYALALARRARGGLRSDTRR